MDLLIYGKSVSFRQAGADFRRVGVPPLERKRGALPRLDWVDPAEVVIRKPGARAVCTALEDKSATVRRNVRLAVDEVLLGHAEERGDLGDLRVGHAHYAVPDPAARPASTALEFSVHPRQWSPQPQPL